MTVFVIIAALLITGALLFILPTLLRKNPIVHASTLHDDANLTVLRDQWRELDADLAAGTLDAPGYEKSRQELEQRVAQDLSSHVTHAGPTSSQNWTAGVIGLAIPVVAIALYFLLGAPAAFDPAKITPAQNQAHEITQEQIETMVAALAQRLKNQPEDTEGWSMLARSYSAMGRFTEAAAAYAQLVTLIPNDATVLADYADTLAMAQNKSLQGEPETLIARALATDPKNIKALALSGSAAFERHDYAGAVQQWNKILALVPPESDLARSTLSSIGEAQNRAGESAPTAANASTAISAGTVGGTVELDAKLRSQVTDTDTVFIFARAAQGPSFPLAVLRKQVKDLPVRFVLDDSMGMVPTAKLSDFPLLVVGARISKSGSATPSSGDLEGLIESVRIGSNDLDIRINSLRK